MLDRSRNRSAPFIKRCERHLPNALIAGKLELPVPGSARLT